MGQKKPHVIKIHRAVNNTNNASLIQTLTVGFGISPNRLRIWSSRTYVRFTFTAGREFRPALKLGLLYRNVGVVVNWVCLKCLDYAVFSPLMIWGGN